MKEDEISLKEVILKGGVLTRYLLGKWVIILIAGLIGSAAGFFYAYNSKFVYTGSLVFALEEDKGASSGLSSIASQFGFDAGGGSSGTFAAANLAELLKSRVLIEKTLLRPVKINNETISLAEYYIRFNNLRDKWAEKKPQLKTIQFLPGENRNDYTLQKDSILGEFYTDLTKDNLSVGPEKKGTFLTIRVTSPDELFSKYLAENIAKEASDFYVETKSRKAKMNVEILEHQADSVRRELNAAIAGVAVVTDNTYNLNPALNVKRVASTTRQVDIQANTAILTELVKNLELARVSLRRETPLIQVIDKPILPLPKQKPGKLRSMQLGGLLAGLLAVAGLLLRRWWRNQDIPVKS